MKDWFFCVTVQVLCLTDRVHTITYLYLSITRCYCRISTFIDKYHVLLCTECLRTVKKDQLLI